MFFYDIIALLKIKGIQMGFNSKSLIGLKKEDVIEILKKMKADYRTYKEDGKQNILTQEFRSERYNLTIEKGIVTNVDMG